MKKEPEITIFSPQILTQQEFDKREKEICLKSIDAAIQKTTRRRQNTDKKLNLLKKKIYNLDKEVSDTERKIREETRKELENLFIKDKGFKNQIFKVLPFSGA